MRIIYFLRSDAGRLVAGPTQQAFEYARAVRSAGHEAEIFSGDSQPPGRFDIAHLLNLDWPLETARQFELAVRCAPVVVISPIHHARPWVEDFHVGGRHGVAKAFARPLGLEGFERLRNVYWGMTRPRLWGETLRQFGGGVAARQRELLERSTAWCVLCERERDSLVADFGLAPRPSFVVRNGGDWSDEPPDLAGLPSDFVLSVGRLEARKNQLALAETLVDLDLAGVFVGGPNPRHRAYVRRFASLIERSPNLTWFPELDRKRILSLYRAARLHALASWYEVVPLVDLEAALAGCPVLTTTRSYTSDYLGSLATYWDPASGRDGLRAAIPEASARAIDDGQKSLLRERFSWERCTEGLVDAYRGLLTEA